MRRKLNEPEVQPADDRLVAAARDGDEKAFARLVERYKATVFATVVAITSDFHAAPDIAQETFLRAWFGLGHLEDTASFGPWLRAIARNRSRTWLERRQRNPQLENTGLEHIHDSGESPLAETERAERERLVMAALGSLPEISREMLVLYYMEGMHTPQMAAQLGVTEAAIRQRLRRARVQMQEEVETMVTKVISERTPGPEFTDGVNAMLDRARRLFGEVKYSSAIPMLQEAREKASNNTMLSMLLAEAYSFGRSAEEMQQDRSSYDRALALFDEVLQQEPDNMLARLRRAALRAVGLPHDEALAEQQVILEDARGSDFEAVAELELARRLCALGDGEEALALYRQLKDTYPWLRCVLYSETGLCHAMAGDVERATQEFKRAVRATTPKAMAALQAMSIELMGDTYWAFWASVDNLSVRQCQNYAWLAGLFASGGDMMKARRHLRRALDFLAADEVGDAHDVLRREFVSRMEEMFPQLAAEKEIQALKREIGNSE